MRDDGTNDHSGGGFDDWLDAEPAPVTDPYKILESEDVGDDGVDLMEKTIEVPVVEDDHDTGEMDALSASSVDGAIESPDLQVEPDAHNNDAQVEVVADEKPAVVELWKGEFSSYEGGDSTQEIKEIAEPAEPAEPAGFAELWAESSDDETDDADTQVEILDRDDHTVDVATPIRSNTESTDHLTSEFDTKGHAKSDRDTSEHKAVAAYDTGVIPVRKELTQDDYLYTATMEHEGLAETIASTKDDVIEHVALTAPLSGLDSTVVGFEDVIEAEGHGKVRARTRGDLVARVLTALVLIAAFVASAMWRPALIVFATAVFVLGAGEFYTALTRSGRRPVSFFGFIGVIGAFMGALFIGVLWIPVSFVLATVLLLLFYAVTPSRDDPIGNLALTVAVMVWVGLGSFMMLIVNADGYRTLIFGVVATVAAMDTAQYFFGRAFGRYKLSPWISPNKTVEGLVAGVVVALTGGVLLHFFSPFDLVSGLAIGVAVAIFSPLGDLTISVIKRSLNLKDMGSLLPGHGGFLDRVDGLLFVIPVAWIIFRWAGIL